MAITKFNYCMSHGKHGHLKSASHRYELGGQRNLGENSEYTFLVSWAVILRDYYAQDNPVFTQIISKPKSCSKASGQHAPNDFQFQEWSIPIDSDLTGKISLATCMTNLTTKPLNFPLRLLARRQCLFGTIRMPNTKDLLLRDRRY